MSGNVLDSHSGIHALKANNDGIIIYLFISPPSFMSHSLGLASPSNLSVICGLAISLEIYLRNNINCVDENSVDPDQLAYRNSEV